MPNWCSNTLTVEGSAVDIARIRSELDTTVTDLHLGALASPWGSDAERHSYFTDDQAWYELQVRYWGTKWAVEAEREDVNDNTLRYRFDSAWSPPVAAVLTFARRNPAVTVTLEYDESGADYAGRVTVRGDDVLENIEEVGLTYWCDVCEEATVCALGSERACDFATLPDSGEASMRHLLDRGATLDEFLDMVTSPEMNTAMHLRFDEWLCDATATSNVLPSMPQRVDVLRHVGDGVAPWCAHLLLSGLSDDDVAAVTDSDDDVVARVGHVGTVGYALWRGYGSR